MLHKYNIIMKFISMRQINLTRNYTNKIFMHSIKKVLIPAF